MRLDECKPRMTVKFNQDVNENIRQAHNAVIIAVGHERVFVNVYYIEYAWVDPKVFDAHNHSAPMHSFDEGVAMLKTMPEPVKTVRVELDKDNPFEALFS